MVMAGPAGRSKFPILYHVHNGRIILIVYESTVIIPVFGIVEIIAHFKIGVKDWIHVALVSNNIQVSRKAGMFSKRKRWIEIDISINASLWR